MFTVIQEDEHEGGRRGGRKRREVINGSHKCCNIMRHVAKEYPHE